MPMRRHDVRKVEPIRPRSFEDQAWPIQIAFVLFGAYVIGIVLATFVFDTPNLMSNAMTWLVLTVVLVVAAVVAVPWLGHRWLKRGLLLSLVLSLILNLSVLVVLSWMNLFPPVLPIEPVPVVTIEDVDQEPLPEFFPMNVDGNDRPKQAHEKPVKTGEPELEQRDNIRKTTVAMETERPEPDEPSRPDVNSPAELAERQEVAQSAPRKFDLQSTLSRQTQLAQPRVAQQILENSPSPQQTEAEKVAAAPSQIQRQAPQVVEQQIDQQTEQASDNQRVTPERLSRTSSSTALPDVTEAAQPIAKTKRSERLQPERVAVSTGARNSASFETKPDLNPANLVTERQQTISPTTDIRPELLAPEGRIREQQVDAERQQPGEQLPQLAEAPDSPRRRQESATIAPRPIDSASPQVTQESGVPLPVDSASPIETIIAKQATSAPASRAIEGPPSANSANMESPASRRTESQTVENHVTPAADSEVEVEVVERAMTRSLVAVSPVNAEATGSVQAERSTVDPNLEPAPNAASIEKQGIAGRGQAPNLDTADAAPQTPATVASAAARREKTSQQTQKGPSLAPAAGARVPRSLAGADTPTTNLRAQSDASADRVDAVTIAPIEANAAAGETQRQADVPQDRQTAQAGRSQIDTGPIRVAANSGQRQPAGGGQPSVVRGMMDATQPVPRSGGARNPALPVPDAARVVAAPPTQDPKGDRSAAAAQPTVSRQAATVGGGATVPENLEAPATESPIVASSSQQGLPSRSRAAEVAISDVVAPGSGTNSRLRSPTARALPVAKVGESVQVASEPDSGGVPAAEPLQADGEKPQRSVDGVYGVATRQPVGSEAVGESRDGMQGATPSLSASTRQASASQQDGPAFIDPLQTGVDAPRARTLRQPSGVVSKVEVDVPLAGVATEESPQPLDEVANAVQRSDLNRSQTGGLVVQLDAPEALGGLASDQSTNVGVVSRQAQEDSQLVADSRVRFIRRNVGGPLSLDMQVAIPTDAFQTRVNRRGEDAAGGNGRPSQRTEEAIELGLVYLAKQQAADGRWSLQRASVGAEEIERPVMRSDTAATGLALLSFLGAGYHHRSDQYQEVVGNGLDFLLEYQKENGDLYLSEDEESARNVWLYSHGIATIALCEAYGMTQDAELKDAAQRAVNFIVAAQHPSRGGWRYVPGVGSDTSVSGWMVMALRSAELANLGVPGSTWSLVDNWLEMAKGSDNRPELYRYNPLAPQTVQQGHGRRPTRTMTSVGLLMRLYTGWQRDNPNMGLGAEYLRSQLPEIGTLRDPQRDTYYWYYATQVMFHMRGENWESWNKRLHPLLTSSQVQTGPLAGSWDPFEPIPDRWADHGGRLYVTTLNLLSLEVYYRHLPIYEDTAR